MCLFSSSAAGAPPPPPDESVEKIPEYDGRDSTDQARDKALRRRRILYGHGSDRLDRTGPGTKFGRRSEPLGAPKDPIFDRMNRGFSALERGEDIP